MKNINNFNLIVLRTSFKHHSIDSGYKQILKFTKPKKVFGIDEHKKNKNYLLSKYKFLYEYLAYFFSLLNKVDIIHIMYGEEYFRFSKFLFKNKPVIVTFHQPEHILKREIIHGDSMGRIMGITSKMNRRRFDKLNAAIVLTKNQKDILKTVMDEKKIYIVPLGFNFKKLDDLKSKCNFERKNIVLTVGNWQRNWDFYFSFVKYAEENFPECRFVLINRLLDDNYKKNILNYKNLEYLENINDKELYENYMTSKVQFLPFKCATGNNSVNEGLALGCCYISNNIPEDLKNKSFAIEIKLENKILLKKIKEIFDYDNPSFQKISTEASIFASDNDWEIIAKKTNKIYKKII